MHSFPLFFQLKDQPVLVVGGGKVALRKARLLCEAGAKVSVVAPQIDDTLVLKAVKSGGEVLYTHFDASFLQGKTLVIAATDDEICNQQVAQTAKAKYIPVNVVDSLALSSVIMPAIVNRFPMTIAISSGGASPVLARLVRAKIESILSPRLGDLAVLMQQYRQAVKQQFSHIRQRQYFWERFLHSGAIEGVLSGQATKSEHRLQQQLAHQNAHTQGEVYLIGAGAGDAELLTFKALRLLQQADVVLYDQLVDEEIVNLARRDADKIYVGKIKGKHQTQQQYINDLLCDYAKQGLRVARLKGGDPSIFGRGGEEIEALRAADIPFYTVPGVTAASVCAASTGIPLTHRDYANKVQLIAGQCQSGVEVDYAELVHSQQTLVFYMGLHCVEEVCHSLIQQGMHSSTPVAIVSHGGRISQRVLVGTLSTLPRQQQKENLPAPALIIVGEVVNLYDDSAQQIIKEQDHYNRF